MDEATTERLARGVGGRFKLASLVMKRLVEINRGSQPMVEPEGESIFYSVLREIDLDLIRFVPRLPAPKEAEGDESVTQEE